MEIASKARPYRVGAKAVIIQDEKILLVEYVDGTGLHYNFPGGGIQPHESVVDGLRREILEETGVSATIGRLLMVGNYFPPDHNFLYGSEPGVTLYFEAHMLPGSLARQPAEPDTHQTGVRWFGLHEVPKTLIPAYHDQVLKAFFQDMPAPIFTTDP